MITVISFVGGLIGLLVSGHFVVGAASKIGARFGLTPMVIGLTIVAAGTSAPELAVVFQSIAAEDTELAVGSIIGSNIANVLLVLGLTAAMGTIRVAARVVRVDVPVMIAASAALLVLSLDERLSRPDGILLVAGLVAFVVWTLRTAPRAEVEAAPNGESTADGSPVEAADGTHDAGDRSIGLSGRGFVAQVGLLIGGIAGLALAARYVVSGAEGIAVSLGVPELIVGLTIVAIGTSTPEIVTTLIAAMNGERDLAVGNAVGSNIFNILLVLGSSTVIAPDGIAISRDALTLDLPILLAAAVACVPVVFWDNKLDRWEGGVFVAYYVAYLIFLVLDATGNRASDPFALVMLAFVMPLTALTVLVVVLRQRSQHRALRSSQPSESTEAKPGGESPPETSSVEEATG